jgi:cell division protein FtsA
MAKRPIISSIDVGTTKVCTTVAELTDEGGLRVIGVGITPSAGMHKGMVVNITEAKDTVRESVRKAEQACGHRIESAYIGVTGRHVTSLNNHGVVSITRGDRMVRTDDLRRVVQSSQSIRVPNDRKLLHVIPRSYAVDGQSTIKNPVGMHGYRLDVETHVITAGISSVQNLAKCIHQVGIDIDELVLEPLASAEAVLTKEEKESGVILADIGGGTTDIAVFREGTIWHTAVLPVAGYQLTRDIAIGLGLPFDVAEEMKKKYGSVMPIYDSAKADPAAMVGNGHRASYQDLCDILRARVEEMLKLTILELPRSETASLVPGGLVLTGGSSNLSGLDVLGRDLLRMPVRIGAPLNMDGISDSLRDPCYATGVGLLVWGAKMRRSPVARTKQRLSFGGGGIRKLVTQLVGLFR